MSNVANCFKPARHLNTLGQQLSKDLLRAEILILQSNLRRLVVEVLLTGILFKIWVPNQSFFHHKLLLILDLWDRSTIGYLRSYYNIVPEHLLKS